MSRGGTSTEPRIVRKYYYVPGLHGVLTYSAPDDDSLPTKRFFGR